MILAFLQEHSALSYWSEEDSDVDDAHFTSATYVVDEMQLSARDNLTGRRKQTHTYMHPSMYAHICTY